MWFIAMPLLPQQLNDAMDIEQSIIRTRGMKLFPFSRSQLKRKKSQLTRNELVGFFLLLYFSPDLFRILSIWSIMLAFTHSSLRLRELESR